MEYSNMSKHIPFTSVLQVFSLHDICTRCFRARYQEDRSSDLRRILLLLMDFAASPTVFRHHPNKFFPVDWFRYIVIAAGLDTSVAVAIHGVSSQGDYRNSITISPEFAACLVAIHNRHLHVH